ncbi:MAG TPA: CoA ester lyase [Thermomicrobiales bacterium]|nr:CoA ester lyase [Thermomicrobiales bacterium]
MPYRSLLFVPGHRESMLAKATQLEADAVVFDLEDSVPPDQRAAAREMVREMLRGWSGAARPFVRLNAPLAGALAEDLTVIDGVDAGVVIPKIDFPVELDAVFDALRGRQREMIVTLETPRSLLRAEEIADTRGVHGIFLGGEDLTNALRSRRTPGGAELTWARNVTLVAARAAGVDAYDTICPEFRDVDTLTIDCSVAASMGFDGKFAIHPAQIPIIHLAFSPSSAEIDHARRIVTAFDDALSQGRGAIEVDGQMVDPPVAERARALLARPRHTSVAD